MLTPLKCLLEGQECNDQKECKTERSNAVVVGYGLTQYSYMQSTVPPNK